MSEPALAVLVDFENLARPGAKSRGDFDIQLVLNRLAEKGRVLVKRAYADWSRYREARHDLQNAGLELIELPSAREGAKNRADIKLAVDAMELAYSREHLDYFVIVSGDSDFTPLVGKVRELNKRVIGIAHKESSSDLLIANCDEFIFYENLVTGAAGSGTGRSARGGRNLDPVDLVRETLVALQREGVEWPLASVVKDSMRRKFPAFDESDHGHSTFSKFLEAMRDHGILRLETDPRSGTYRVELAESTRGTVAPRAAAAPAEERAPAGENGEGRRRRRRRRGGGAGEGDAAGPDGAGPVTDADDGMEVFEVTVTPTPDPDLGTLPDLDQPISYEDMLMLSADVAADLPPVPEVAEAAGDGPPPREARRRRRRVKDDDATVEDLEAVEETPQEADAEDAPAAEDGAAQAEAPADAPATPSGRRRVRRGAVAQVLGIAPAGDDAETPGGGDAAAAGDAPAQEEAPKPKRRSRAKKADADAEAAPAEATPAEAAPAEATPDAPAEEEAPKPKRRSRAKKADADAETAPAEATPDAPAEEEAPKPKRRSRAKKADADAEAAPAEATPDAPADGEAPAPKRRVRRKPAEPAAGEE